MIAKLQRAATAAANESLVAETSSREASMIAERADGRLLQPHQHDLFGRRLRNRIIFANAIAWIVIVVLIRVVLF
jgi:hypothetical protein